SDKVTAVDGQEVTTFAYGHFNAFPLAYQPVEFNGGAVFPYDKQPAELFAAIRAQQPDDEIIQINHPRGTSFGAYFSYVGFDNTTGEVEFPEEWDLNWDTIEVFNGNCGRGEPLNDWIAMTNLGLNKVLASGSDSHRENDPIGFPRNWIQVDRADAAADRQALVEPVRGRRVFVSCGPFVRFETEARDAGIGDRITPNAEGEVAFWVQVQAPNWIQLDEVRLWRNGVAVDTVPIENQDSGVRFEMVLRDTPAADAWYAVEVIGSGSLQPVYFRSPYALTNPIEVDANADGQWDPPGL
ncbi:MAG: CehA/McbA family metallohydrolase, partial [Myxococcota bacterium]